MTEKVKIDSGSSAASLLWQAMLHTGDEDLWETFGIELGFKELVVDVTVTVNGVEIPFIEEVGSFLGQYRTHVQNEAKRMVRKGIVDTHLDTVEEALSELIEHIRDADKDITDKLCCVLGRNRS